MMRLQNRISDRFPNIAANSEECAKLLRCHFMFYHGKLEIKSPYTLLK